MRTGERSGSWPGSSALAESTDACLPDDGAGCRGAPGSADGRWSS